MGYTIPYSKIQFICESPEGPKAMKPVQLDWYCDPCALSHARYEVTHPAGKTIHAWWEVILPDDDDRTIAAKLEHFKKVGDAFQAVVDARNNFYRISGTHLKF